MKFGLDRLLADPDLRKPLHGRRVALVAHPASVTEDLTHSLDALAAAGDVTRIDVPKRGQWIRQGQRIIAMQKDGMELDLVSPIEGTVVDINENVVNDPKLARTDPYGEGWLLTVNAPDAKTNFRNLLSGTVARRWMDDAAAK